MLAHRDGRCATKKIRVGFVSVALGVVYAHAAGEALTVPLRIDLTSPLDYQVVQRASRNEGSVVVAGVLLVNAGGSPPVDALEARATANNSSGDPVKRQPLAFDTRVAAFRDTITLPAGGWYRLEVRAFRRGAQVAETVVAHFGVGEVFVVAGQSNSANYGEKKQTTRTEKVAAFDGKKWQLAADPEPGAGGGNGSFMPPFGDEMAERFHVPIGIVATSIGATSVREWLASGIRFSRLPTLTGNVVTVDWGQWESSGRIFEHFIGRLRQMGPNGFRAVLWHQGESDAHQADPDRTLPGALYRQYLERLILDSRHSIGWDAPWFVARASYHSAGDTASADIRAAQASVWADGVALPGPDTDTLTGSMREQNGAGVHLSDEGLKAHAHLWFEKVSPWLEEQLGGR